MFKRSNKQSSTPNRRRMTRKVDVSTPPPAAGKSFRRNRTLTGSSSGQVSSSNELNAQLRSPRAHIHHLHHHRRHLLRRFVIVAVGALLLYIMASQLVATVTVTTREQYDKPLSDSVRARYHESVNMYYSANPLQRFRPSLDQPAFNDFMQVRHPEVSSVETTLTGKFGYGEVALGFRQPVARWAVDGRTNYVDQDGVVFSENVYATPAVTIVDKNDITVQSKYVTSNRFLSFVGSVVGRLNKMKLTVTQATIPALTTRQLEVKLRGVSYPFKLTVDRPAGEQAEDIARIVMYMNKTGKKPQYVDVRTRGKAAYKE